MALEIDFESASEVDYRDLIDFFTWQSAGQLLDPEGSPFLRTPGIDVSPYVIAADSEEEARHAALMGFRRRVLVTFRLRPTATDEEQQAAWAMMLNSVLTFIRNHSADAALVYNGEQVIMRSRDKEVVFDNWEGFEEEPAMAAIVAGYPRETLDQPLL